MTVLELAKKYKDYGIEMRREFHMNPESSLCERRTSRRVLEELHRMGIDAKIIGETGVVGFIKGNAPGKTIALRADMDALEIREECDLPYKSQDPGLMHACGHDAHTGSLLAAAEMLNELKDSFKGQVKLIFQPAEENARGAKKLIEAGVMEGVDGVFGIHLWNGLEKSKVSVEAGPRMASAGIFKINITGKGGHGSLPHEGVDAILVGSAMVQNLQSIISREISPVDPTVITVGIFRAGTRFNVMSGDAYLEGTTRCFSRDVNDGLEGMMNRVVSSTADTFRAKAILDYEQLVKPVINDVHMSSIAKRCVVDLWGDDKIITQEKLTVGEDYSYYSDFTPSMFAFVGAKDETQDEYYPHHHPKFTIDEEGIETSSCLYTQFALEFLK